MKKFFKYLFYILNATTLLLLLASAFSDHVSPQAWLLPSFIGFLFPGFLIINILFLTVWLFSTKWKAVLCNIVVFIVAWGNIQAYYPINIKREKKAEGTPVKLMTYNVMGFAYKDHTDTSPNPIIKYVIDEDPDIICFQEYFVNKKNKALNQKTVTNAFGKYPYKKFLYLEDNDVFRYGLAVYSKFPITGVEQINYKSQFNGSAIFHLEIDGKKVSLINNHLESNRITDKDRLFYQSLRYGNIGSETLGTLKNSIVGRLRPAFLLRAQQANAIAAKIKEQQTD